VPDVTVPPDLATPVPDTGPSATILVVEDSAMIAAVVRYYLELEGFRVLTATDGAAGLELAQREHPQAIVTDISMPGMDGITMVRALRASPETKDIAVLMLTGENNIDSETDAMAAGADAYLLKPVEPRRLAAHVRALLKRADHVRAPA
jgi:DNA-binding response OmpR family regulator